MADTQTFACPDCGEQHPSFSKLKRHMYYVHGRTVSKAILYGAPRPLAETQWFTCDHCGERFQGATAYGKHQREMRQYQEQSRRDSDRMWARLAEQSRQEQEEYNRLLQRRAPPPVVVAAPPTSAPPPASSATSQVVPALILGSMGLFLAYVAYDSSRK
jgi:hypothetical protein